MDGFGLTAWIVSVVGFKGAETGITGQSKMAVPYYLYFPFKSTNKTINNFTRH